MRAIQLTWGTWSEVCDFVQHSQFVRGTFLDGQGAPTSNANWSFGDGSMGLILRTPDGKEELAREGEWLVKDSGGNVHIRKSFVN